MSDYMSIQAQRLLVDPTAAPTSQPSSARSSTNKSDVPAKAKGGSATASPSSTPATTPPLKALKHGSPMPPLPAPKASPRRVSSEGKPPAVSGTTSAHSRSLSASSSDSDDDFVYMLDSVKTTAEAVERIRAVQQPKERSLTAFFLNGLPGASSNTNLAEAADSTPGKKEASSTTAAPPRRMKGGLPANMEEFYECPRYTVSLTAAREAIFSDALSGFHSYVEREQAQRDQLRALQHHHHHHHSHSHSPQQTQKEKEESRVGSSGSSHAHALPSFSSGATEEWSAALAATTPSPEKKTAPAVAPLSETAVTKPLRFSDDASPGAAALTSFASPPHTDDTVTTATASASGVADETGVQPLSASYMFIMRSRDTEAMSPVSSPRVNPQGRESGKLHRAEDAEEVSGPPRKIMSPLEDPALATHADPQPLTAAAAAAAPAPQTPSPTSPVKVVSDREQASKLEAMQLQTLLQERIYQRERVPVVFRCRCAAEFAETREEYQQRVQMRERVLRHQESVAGPGGLTHAMRRRIRDRYGNPNTVAPEWPYVWEQFVRDIPRETLFIDDTAHRDADDALAAIMSYLEYCYDRVQRNVKERLDKALADASKSSGNGASVAGGNGAPATASEQQQQQKAPSPTPPASKPKGFFESLFSAGSAAIKGAVVTVRASLPDFVGDPLLSVSGLDPALYHTSLLFPADAKARSEKIFTAVREVVLASQQSFMGFPYQLLCEQVGTERLGLALEALEMDQDEEDDDGDAAAAGVGGGAAGTAAPTSVALSTPTTRTGDASAPILIRKADDSDPDLRREASTSSVRSPLHNSRVVRIYQSFPSPTLLSGSADGPRRHRVHASHVVDEWNVSPSSSSNSLHTADVTYSPASPGAISASTTITQVPSSAAITADAPAAAPTAGQPPQASSPRKTATKDGSVTSDKSLLAAARPPPLQSPASDPVDDAATKPAAPQQQQQQPQPPVAATATTTTTTTTTTHTVADRVAQQRRRERRRRRRSQLPLLVGEPRPHEFAAFLDLVRARVAAKAAKEERKARERQRRERVMRMVERQREQWHSTPGSHTTSRAASSASLDTLTKAAVADAAPIKASKLFREDVEGSAYLLPTQPTASQVPASPLSSSMVARQAMPPETRGMRICLFFDERRNVPVVVVNKLFRLFTVPGLRGLTSSSDEEEAQQQQQQQPLVAHEVAALHSRNIDADGVDRTPERGGAATRHSEKSLLLLIQVQFSLFTKEEAEVRWKWWKV